MNIDKVKAQIEQHQAEIIAAAEALAAGLRSMEQVGLDASALRNRVAKLLGIAPAAQAQPAARRSKPATTGTRKSRASFGFDDVKKLLGGGEMNTSQLKDKLKTTPITISKHLKNWQKEGKVTSRKDGQSVLWRAK